MIRHVDATHCYVERTGISQTSDNTVNSVNLPKHFHEILTLTENQEPIVKISQENQAIPT